MSWVRKALQNKLFKNVLKGAITLLALYFIYTRIDLAKAWVSLKEANLQWLILAWILFIGSKMASAMRLLDHFTAIGLKLPWILNLKLYALGMYYNLFLPGGIGGDGYKAYWLNKHYQTPLKRLITSLLLDRINGLVALVALALLFGALVSLPFLQSQKWIFFLGILGAYLLHGLILKRFFPRFVSTLLPSHGWSLLVQILQVGSVYAIYTALGVEESWLSYVFIFLLSSVVSVLPLTIGGIGSREVVFLLGAEWLSLNQDTAVTISLIFYVLTALTSLGGVYFTWYPLRSGKIEGSVANK
ncbi:MAG: lysylphosphatidylglycerol synthase transmembrane domain-containing protein [Bacteroidota bacterium]